MSLSYSQCFHFCVSNNQANEPPFACYIAFGAARRFKGCGFICGFSLLYSQLPPRRAHFRTNLRKMLLCCGIRPKRTVVAPAPPSPYPPPPAELYDSDAKDQSYFSELSTFAEIKMPKRPRSSCQQVINTMPYFGPFACRRVTFVVEESRTTVLVDNQHITNRLDFTQGRSGRSIKDRCIAFLHATGRDGAHCEYNVPSPKPPTLKFFCERRIWLSGETPLGMPLAEARRFNQYPKQTLKVNVWPSSVVRAQPMAKKLKISVPVCLSFGELEYFMREALYLQSSHAALHLREPEGIYPLQPSDPLKPHHRELECFVRVPPVCLTTP